MARVETDKARYLQVKGGKGDGSGKKGLGALTVAVITTISHQVLDQND